MGLFDRLRSKALVPKTKAAVGVTDFPIMEPPGWGGFWPIVREAFPGAWQQNIVCSRESILSFSTLYACVTLIASDIAKLRLKLMMSGAKGIWTEVQNPAFSPVLRKPNGYQNRIQFLTSWLLSKLIWGNAYILIERDKATKVRALYVLDPGRVRPAVTPTGDVFYECSTDYLAELEGPIMLPASEIIHDMCPPLFHPLVGVSPIFACNLAAVNALKIQENNARFYANGAKISGIITAPGQLGKDKAEELKKKFDDGYTGENAGKIAVLADGLKFTPLTMTSTDAQMIDMLRLSQEQVASAFHVPGFMVGVGTEPSRSNVEALWQQYYATCLQIHVESIELCLDEGLSLPPNYGVEVDIAELLRMDTATRIETSAAAIQAAIMTPNEARALEGLAPKEGGDQLYLQQQNYSLPALAARDAELISNPGGKPPPAPGAKPGSDPAAQDPGAADPSAPPDQNPDDSEPNPGGALPGGKAFDVEALKRSIEDAFKKAA